jgi:hypothetical protein
MMSIAPRLEKVFVFLFSPFISERTCPLIFLAHKTHIFSLFSVQTIQRTPISYTVSTHNIQTGPC